MTFAWTIVALAALGVDVGWQPRDGGGMEYIIQVPPESAESLRDGHDIISDVPQFLRDARSIRFRVGQDILPQRGLGAAAAGQPTPARPHHAAPPLLADVGWQPLEGGGMEFIIQVTQDLLGPLLDGEEIVGDVPDSMRDVRSCRIRLGSQPPPQKGFKSALAAASQPPASPGKVVGEPTPARPKPASAEDAGPDLAPATVRGQQPEPAGETLAQARARRFHEQNGSIPKRLDEEPPAEDAIVDYGADFSAVPSAVERAAADRGGRVQPAQFRDDQPASRTGSGSSSKTSAASNRGSQFGNSKLAQKPTRAALPDDEDETERSNTTSGTKTRPAGSSSTKPKTSGTTTGTSGARTTRTKDSADADEASEQSKPWFPLTMALIALFASLGGNWYLGWMNWDLRNKVQRVLNDRKWRREEYESERV